MSTYPEPLDLSGLRVLPLSQRRSLSTLEEILIDPSASPPPCPPAQLAVIAECSRRIRAAKEKNASVMLIYGAHLIKNGGQLLLNHLLERKWVTHLATNGAGTIHDFEFALLGRSTESVRDNVATGSFGTWDETGRYINLAVLAGGILGEGYGRSLGRFIFEDGVTLPTVLELETQLRSEPGHPLAPARADLLLAMRRHELAAGRQLVVHPYRNASVLAQAWRHAIPVSVHPGIGYDIIANHPMFNGAAIGRGAELDFRLFGTAVERLDGGVVLSIGSAIMGPQVFEKSLSCVNNLRLQAHRPIVQDHTLCVVDLQDGGNWDWTRGEPPRDNPAYYLRFCKSFARMGGTMHYLQSDNIAFLQNLIRALESSGPSHTAV